MRISSVLGGVILLAVLIPFVGGCVDDTKVQQLTIMNANLQKQLVDKDAEIARLQERLAWYDKSQGDVKGSLAEKAAQMARMQEEIDALKAALAKAQGDYIALANKAAGMSGGRLSAPVTLKLKALQEQYPGLFTFDEERGELRLASDVTFDSGSDAVKADAKEALGKLAAILQDPVAAKVTGLVVGYTDNARVSKPETVKKFHDNQGLSQARAEAVKAILTGAGVAAERINTKGMGEGNPMADNKTAEGRAKNRRVEIYLKEGGPLAPAAPAPAAPTAIPAMPPPPSGLTK
jgi:outer membrane protein OmpA-like peptidoglycan-associated protein